MNKIFGIALIVLALGIGIIPHYTDCLSQGNTLTLANGKTQPMKCHWSAQAEIGAAIPLGLMGAVLITSRNFLMAGKSYLKVIIQKFSINHKG